jgi:hypothetical protein
MKHATFENLKMVMIPLLLRSISYFMSAKKPTERYAAVKIRRPTRAFCPIVTHGEWQTRRKMGCQMLELMDVAGVDDLRDHPSCGPLAVGRWRKTS